jgi:hypothetical protein
LRQSTFFVSSNPDDSAIPASVRGAFDEPCLVHKNGDCDSIPGIPTVVHVIAVPGVIDIHIIVVVPVVWPVFWPRVNNAEPEAAVLKAGIPANHHHGVAVDAEHVIRTKVPTITVLWNPVAVVAAALLPGAVLGLPVMRTITLPSDPLFASVPVLLLLWRSIDLLLTLLLLLVLVLLLLLSVLLLVLLLLRLFRLSLLLLFRVLPPNVDAGERMKKSKDV